MHSSYEHVRAEGALLPLDLLLRIAGGDADIDGLAPANYHLAENERLNEVSSSAFNRLEATWKSVRAQLDGASWGVLYERWLRHVFRALEFGSLETLSQGITLGERRFALTHKWRRSPVHIASPSVGLDAVQRVDETGFRASAHGLVQDFLNRTDEYLWGIVTDGFVLRVLRDHHSLTRHAYVEFDLRAMFEASSYADFALFYRVCHSSRFEPRPVDDSVEGAPAKPEGCWLERWFSHARKDGVRALDRLRDGVTEAVRALGAGLVRHPQNRSLREALQSQTLTPQDFYRQLLRLAYRLVLVFVAEERGVLLARDATPRQRERYQRFYALRGIRELSLVRRGGPHSDLWERIALVFDALDGGCAPLGVAPLGGYLFSRAAVPWMGEARVSNEDVLAAFRALSRVEDKGHNARTWPVDWRAVGAEELGSVYESLLELSPSVASNGTFELKVVGGNERKTTGSYYTPSALVEVLLEQALDPVLDEACKKPESERQEALLSLTVCDPACGSGHFLLAAARRIARRLASERAHGNEPSPEAVRHALREVIARCIYGVDINPMAVELCKVSLWMEALEPGLPLSFLDGHIQCGNALLGATPALMRRGIPEGAFEEIEGDDKKVVKALKKQHKAERSGQLSLGVAMELPVSVLPTDVREVEKTDARTIEAELKKQRAYEDLVRSERYQRAKFLADAWCSVFVIPKTSDTRSLVLTEDTWRRLVGDSHAATSELRSEVERRTRRFQFFHWHVAFPRVFDAPDPNAAESVAGWTGGFDVVLGNPPWVAHAGRAAHPLPPGVKRFYESNYSAFADYPTTHGVFVSVAPTILREGGRLGVIIPSSVSELGGYEPTRAAHDRLSAFDGELVDFGEGQFVGVTQPSMALVSRRSTGGRKDAQPGQPWPVARPDMTALDRALLQRLASMPTLPSELFGDRGLQSDRSLAEHICETRESSGRFSTPIREGADIREFELLPAQHYVDAEALAGRLRPPSEFAEVRVVIRQTARYPIAALSDGVAFRNSLLAGFESSEWPAAALVALLNSALIRWCHYMRYRDARQPVMPQVKVGHLKSVPAPVGTTHAKELVRLSKTMVEALGSERASVVRRELDAFVAQIYGLNVAEADAVQRWHDRLGPRASDVSAVSAEASAGTTSRASRGRRAKDLR